jgi:capsular exopolysaccharide synthesis family protein
MYTYLSERKSENELIKVATVSDYEMIDTAYGSNIPVRPKRLVVLILAGLIGFSIGVFLALLRSQLIYKIYNKKDIEALTTIPFYGMIPLYKEYTLFTISIKEAYHKLATNLLFFNKEEEGNIVLITSHEKGEGKTTTITSLAAVLNNLGLKTILIDFNLREPALHNYFGIEHQYSGISTFLSNRDNIGNIIFSTNYPNLDIITSGPTAPNPIELTISPKLPELLKILKERYAYIIIDTNCYKDAHETLHLMKYADTNLVVFRENFSKKMAIDEMEELMKQKGIKNMGVVYKYVPKDEVKLNEYELLEASKLKPQKPIKLI